MIFSELRNAGGEPNALTSHRTVPDQQHRILAGGWHRRISGEEIVDDEVPVSGQRYAGFVEGGGCGGRPAEKRGVNARSCVGSNAIPSRQKQAASSDPDVSIGLHYCIQVGDPPRSSGIHTAYDVEVDCPIRGDAGYRNDPNAALEFHVHVVLSGGDASESECDERHHEMIAYLLNKVLAHLFSSSVLIFACTAVIGLIRRDEILREFAFGGAGYSTSSHKAVRSFKEKCPAATDRAHPHSTTLSAAG